MKNDANVKKKIKSLRSFHAFFAALSLLTMLNIIFMDNSENWFSYLPIFIAICFDGKFEKKDELAKLNLAKANVVTMWALIAALIVMYTLGRYNAIPAYYYLIAISGALTLRSALFLIFDITPKSEELFE